MEGRVGNFTRNEERAQTPGHTPVILTGKLKANNGIYPTGLLLTRNAGGELIPLVIADNVAIETGDGDTKAFTGTLAAIPVEPGTVAITDGVETFADDGCGRLTGSAGGTGTVNYKTGVYSITFNANVVNEVDVVVDCTTAIAGVLDEETDTAKSGTGIYVAHGTVDTTVLKIGIASPAAPAAATLMLLQAKGIYPK